MPNETRHTVSRLSGPFVGFRLKRFYKTFIEKDNLCFDIGANGQHTQAWLSLDARSISVAADERSANSLEKQFGNNKAVAVVPAMPTLDILIARHGMPDFCRIDAYYDEEEILKGLSQPLKQLSFVYDIGDLASAVNCVNLLEQLGDYEFNWSYRRALELAKKWTSPAGMRTILHGFSAKDRSGEVYARLKSL